MVSLLVASPTAVVSPSPDCATPADRDRHGDPGSPSSTCPGPPPGRSRRCGCGGPAPADRTWTGAGGPTSAPSPWRTPSASPKLALGWTTPRVRTPEQADRWTWLVLIAYTQLRLGR